MEAQARVKRASHDLAGSSEERPPPRRMFPIVVTGDHAECGGRSETSNRQAVVVLHASDMKLTTDGRRAQGRQELSESCHDIPRAFSVNSSGEGVGTRS